MIHSSASKSTHASKLETYRLKIPLAAIILSAACILTFAVRIYFIYHSNGVVDGDEALVGIQAQSILHGEHPVYFYGQAYMGSLEAYLVSIIFVFGGASFVTLRLEPAILSVVACILVWKLASLLSLEAKLPLPVSLWFKVLAVFFTAVMPIYDVVIEMRTLGGYVEAYIIMLLLLISGLLIVQCLRLDASRKEMLFRWLGFGFLVGLGFWVNPLMISALVAVFAYMAIDIVVGRVKRKVFYNLRKLFLSPLISIPGFIAGALPAIIWGFENNWQNVAYIFASGTNMTLHQKLHAVHQVSVLYADCVSPRILGGFLPIENTTMKYLHAGTLILSLLFILAALSLYTVSYFINNISAAQIRGLLTLPILFGAVSAFIFCTSPSTASGFTTNCVQDFTGRYASPLMLATPFLYASVIVFILFNISRYIKKTDDQESLKFFIPPKVLQGVLVLIIAVYGALQSISYVITDPGRTFQSTYCLDAPAKDEPVIAYMQRNHIQYAWATNFIANPITFKTDSDIIAADPTPLIANIQYLNRIPAYTDRVLHADRPALLVLVSHSDNDPQLLKTLDNEHVSYQSIRFYSQPGIDLLLVQPVSRTVSPMESNDFKNMFTCPL